MKATPRRKRRISLSQSPTLAASATHNNGPDLLTQNTMASCGCVVTRHLPCICGTKERGTKPWDTPAPRADHITRKAACCAAVHCGAPPQQWDSGCSMIATPAGRTSIAAASGTWTQTVSVQRAGAWRIATRLGTGLLRCAAAQPLHTLLRNSLSFTPGGAGVSCTLHCL